MLMQQELYSEPNVIRSAIAENESVVKEIAKVVKDRGIKNITIIGRGTSDNAGLCFKYITEILSGIPVGTAHPSVTTMYDGHVDYGTHLVVAVSQSGKSVDTLAVLDNANKKGGLTVAVTNDPLSPLAKAAKHHLFLAAGEEKSVAATKTFAAELVVLYMLAIALSGKNLMHLIYGLPDKVNEILNLIPKIRLVAEATRKENNFIILSRGTMQGVGKELALKLAECCYSFACFYSVTDFMHGPLALLEDGVNVILIAPGGECTNNYIDIATRAKVLGANIYSFSDIPEVLNISNAGVKMPEADFISATLTYAMAIHLFSLNLSIEKGLNPDAPRNLKKVTITK